MNIPMPIIDTDQQPDAGASPELDPKIITYDDCYSLELFGVESEAVPYGQPLEWVRGQDHWLAYCDLDLKTDEVFTTLEFYAYCNGRGVEVEIEDAEEDEDEDNVGGGSGILIEADPHAGLVGNITQVAPNEKEKPK